MALVYEPAPSNVMALVERVLQSNFTELAKEGVTVNVLMASRINNKTGEDEHCLYKDGMPVAAQISITQKRDRARGLQDAKLVIDTHTWQDMKDTHRAALVDHELRHLRLVEIRPTKRNGYKTGVKHDDLGRPSLRPRPHDWVLTGFAKSAELYGEYSHEARQIAYFRAEFGAQLNLFGPTALAALEADSAKAVVPGSKKPKRAASKRKKAAA